MKSNSISLLNLVTNFMVFLLLVYMFKTVAGVDLVTNCHAEEFITASCPSSS
ncbi:hypothetical protein [Gloeothece citriformis]|uniref:hypothetical protein n=1 Tax=Gloeothece citriformis TaxID=2546356 RepID=UPI00030CE446|nr:hypothetical protein [Gloeothece citriformis]